MRLPIIFLCFLLSFNHIEAQCDHPDYDALMQFYESTQGDSWFNNFGWNQGANEVSCNPCDLNGSPWPFVYCTGNRVTSLLFDQNNLQGEIPDIQMDALKELAVSQNPGIVSIPDFTVSEARTFSPL